MFELVDSSWDTVIEGAAKHAANRMRLVCPFIKWRTVVRLLAGCAPQQLEVITRFRLEDFYEGVSDISALQMLLQAGAKVRGIKGLHAKLYLFGDVHVVLTSANLTEAALLRNREFGFLSDEVDIAAESHAYFERLWQSAGSDVTMAQLAEWMAMVIKVQAASGARRAGSSLPDFGTTVATIAPNPLAGSPIPFDTTRAYVKLFGTSTTRAAKAVSTLEEIERSGCHWGLSYPMGLPPRSVQDGDVMYIARLAANPNDSLIYGRARALRHEDVRDVASAAAIARRPWKAQWPRLIRVHHPEFLAGSIGNGVSLLELMEALGSDSFASTQRNAARGEGNIVPRRALMQKAHVELTPQAFRWLDTQLEARFSMHGKLPANVLMELDQPE